MATTVQVVNAIGNTLWTTDKVEFATTLSNVTFQVSVVQLTYKQANGWEIAPDLESSPIGIDIEVAFSAHCHDGRSWGHYIGPKKHIAVYPQLLTDANNNGVRQSAVRATHRKDRIR